MSERPWERGWMGCDKGDFEKMNRKANTRTHTSLFLSRLLAEQLSPKSQLVPECCPPIFPAKVRRRGSLRRGKKRQRGRKRRTATHVPVCACLLTQACLQKVHVHPCTHGDTHTHSHSSSNSSSNSRPFSNRVWEIKTSPAARSSY